MRREGREERREGRGERGKEQDRRYYRSTHCRDERGERGEEREERHYQKGLATGVGKPGGGGLEEGTYLLPLPPTYYCSRHLRVVDISWRERREERGERTNIAVKYQLLKEKAGH